MKTCFIYPHLPPVVDGVGDYTCHLARELARSGCEVAVLTSQLGGEACHVRPLPEQVRLYRCVTTWGTRGLRAIVGKVREIGCDVVSIQYTPFAYGQASLGMYLLPHLLRRRLSCRISITLHEPWIPFAGAVHRWGTAVWQRVATACMVAPCDHVIVTTERRRRHLQRLMFPAGAHVAMVPVGSNIPFVTTDRQAARQRLGVGDEETLFATFGTTLPNRDYEALYRGLHRLSAAGIPCRLVSIGKITHQRRLQSLCRLERELGLEERICWTGFCEAAAVSAFLQAADVYVMPDHFGASTRATSLMAALQHGLAVIAWRGPETDPVLERTAAIAFAPAGDEAGLAAAMKGAALDPGARAAMGVRARALFERHFSWPRIAAQTLKVYGQG